METRTALVTGAAQGLGQEFAVALAGRGYRVAGFDLVPQTQTAGKVLDYLELVGRWCTAPRRRPTWSRRSSTSSTRAVAS